MIVWEITYFAVSYVVFVFVSGALTGWAIRIGAEASEWQAKAAATLLRFAQAIIASALLYILWFPILGLTFNNGVNVRGGGIVLFLACVYTLFFGGNYVLGGLLAGITSLMAEQNSYLRELRAKRSVYGPPEQLEQIPTPTLRNLDALPMPDIDRLEVLGLTGRYPDGKTFQRVDEVELACRQSLLDILDSELGPSERNSAKEFQKSGLIQMAIGSNRHRSNLEAVMGTLKSESAADLVRSGRAKAVLLRLIKTP
jgi:hypothetical protein